jgi:hypothetical protein
LQVFKIGPKEKINWIAKEYFSTPEEAIKLLKLNSDAKFKTTR